MMQELASGQVVAARFELERPLATGHDARTWLAREAGSGREFVLRFHEPASVTAASRLPAGLRHPALLAPLETLTVGAASVDVFDYLEGGEIGRWRGRPWSLIARLLLPVADALAQVHEAGFVHGDVKTANVLLAADGGARLADFGSAQRIGSSRPTAGSPYSTSPERLDGAAAAPSADVYAFGVLLYELVSGHPPFYPDLTPDRVRNEIPPALTGRPTPPAALCALVARCLAKRPDERPASMRELYADLERCLADEPDVPNLAPAADWQPRPPADSAPIRPQWQRPTASTPSAGDLRREGFRRGLLVGGAVLAAVAFAFTFFVLPDLVASKQPVATTTQPVVTTPVAQEAAPAADLAGLAEQKQRAQERRAALAPRLQELERRDVANWAAADLARLRADLAAGDAAFAARQFAVALDRLDAVAAGLAALEQRWPKVVQERLAVAQAAFVAGRSAAATAAFRSVLAVDPTNAPAQRGIERSRVLDEVLRETGSGARAEQAGDVAAATSAYRRALQLDPATAAARDGLARLQARASGDAFAAAVAQAQSALARRDYPAAQAAYERAQRLRPGSPEVAEGLQQ
ncbi:MAG TPA: serine/threonine-protein kinase, partial [Steroidobacteraceae bacterium]